MADPSVTIGLPCFNSEATLELALKSVFAQTFEDRHALFAARPGYHGALTIFCFHGISTMRNSAAGRKGSSIEANAGGAEPINADNSRNRCGQVPSFRKSSAENA